MSLCIAVDAVSDYEVSALSRRCLGLQTIQNHFSRSCLGLSMLRLSLSLVLGLDSSKAMGELGLHYNF